MLHLVVSCQQKQEKGRRMMMQRLLLADPSGVLSTAIRKQLKNEFIIESCADGEQALKLLRKIDPDIFLVNLQLPLVDGLAVLRTLRGCGMDTKVIALTSLTNEYIMRELERLQVSMVLMNTSRLTSVISHIRSVSLQLEQSLQTQWDAESEADRILLDLSFRVGTGTCCVTHAAVLYMYHNLGCYLTKCLYPDLAKEFGGTKTQIEKAIRDSINYAWEHGDRQIWNMYFPQNEKPSNEVFLGRIAYALQQRSRLKRPYIPCQLKAQ